MGGTPERPVLVVEPRRVACRSLASFVASSVGSEVGEAVGYRIRFTDQSGPETRILFVTPGVALRMLHEGGEAALTPRASRSLQIWWMPASASA